MRKIFSTPASLVWNQIKSNKMNCKNLSLLLFKSTRPLKWISSQRRRNKNPNWWLTTTKLILRELRQKKRRKRLLIKNSLSPFLQATMKQQKINLNLRSTLSLSQVCKKDIPILFNSRLPPLRRQDPTSQSNYLKFPKKSIRPSSAPQHPPISWWSRQINCSKQFKPNRQTAKAVFLLQTKIKAPKYRTKQSTNSWFTTLTLKSNQLSETKKSKK